MRKTIILAAAALAAGCTPAEPVEMTADEEARLATELAGLEPGSTVSCVSTRDLRGNRSVGEGVILFEGSGDTVYVNRPAGGCPELGFGRALQTKSTTSQLCRGDIATVFEPGTGMSYGGCGLGDFTPYRRARG
jgi:hypothetical protein